MRRTITGLFLLFLLFLFLIAGCDPGMTIRQVVQRGGVNGIPATPSPGNLTISVRTSHPLKGENWYAPDVTVTNSSASPISINSFELAAKSVVYGNKRQEGYPVVLASGETRPLRLWFDLREDIWKTFSKEAADLRVNYVIDGQQMTAHANIIGERLSY
ncbi:MAG TPA: hypothetical protein VF532_23555 [Candidatus Angelobacter sp.]